MSGESAPSNAPAMFPREPQHVGKFECLMRLGQGGMATVGGFLYWFPSWAVKRVIDDAIPQRNLMLLLSWCAAMTVAPGEVPHHCRTLATFLAKSSKPTET